MGYVDPKTQVVEAWKEIAHLGEENTRLRGLLIDVETVANTIDLTPDEKVMNVRLIAALRDAHEQSAPAECTHAPMKNALDDGVSCIRCGADLGRRS